MPVKITGLIRVLPLELHCPHCNDTPPGEDRETFFSHLYGNGMYAFPVRPQTVAFNMKKVNTNIVCAGFFV
jgi:hypothetical protein